MFLVQAADDLIAVRMLRNFVGKNHVRLQVIERVDIPEVFISLRSVDI